MKKSSYFVLILAALLCGSCSGDSKEDAAEEQLDAAEQAADDEAFGY